MIGWLKRSIAWAVASAELQELERWRVECSQAERWFSEFPDVVAALDHLKRCARGVENPLFISDVRDAMRRRRDRAAKPGPFSMAALVPPRTMTPAEVEAFARKWDSAPRFYGPLKSASLAELEAATDWDVAAQVVSDLERARERVCDAVDNALANPPTHFTGLTAPAPRRVAYKFLSPGCDERS